MKNSLFKIYTETVPRNRFVKAPDNKIKVEFYPRPRVEISGSVPRQYEITFQQKSGEVLYASVINNNMWAAPSLVYFVDWIVQVKAKDSSVANQFRLDLKGKKVKITNESPSIGDTVAWFPYLNEFQQKHECFIDFYSPYINILDNQNPNIALKEYSRKNNGSYYAAYELGYFYDKEHSPVDARLLNLQELACKILGLEFKEIRPKLKFQPLINFEGKYVCISTASTSGCKHWQNPTGWQQTVDYLNELGYKVVVLQKEELDYMDLKGLNNVIHPKTESLSDVLSWLASCEFFVGLGSGVSWLAWALEKPVVLISGFSLPKAEFETPYRVINTNVCNGCWNDPQHQFDGNNWNWCPRDKNFECSKEISFEMVKEKINLIVTG